MTITHPTVHPLHDAAEPCLWCDMTDTGPQAKAEGAAAVHRDLPWWQEADLWLQLQKAGSLFTADDLTDCVGMPQGHANQIGARIRGWARARQILPHGYTTSTRQGRHAGVVRVWEVRA
jgi:hypothetical protein